MAGAAHPANVSTISATRAHRMPVIPSIATVGLLSSCGGLCDKSRLISTDAAEQLADSGLHIQLARVKRDPAVGRAASVGHGAVEPSGNGLEDSGVERLVRATLISRQSHVEAWDEHDLGH